MTTKVDGMLSRSPYEEKVKFKSDLAMDAEKNDNGIPIKLNTATILRENHLISKLQERENELLEAYEKELHNPAEFIAWQRKMKEQDDLLQLYYVDCRRAMAKISNEEAKLAFLKKQEDNRIMVQQLKIQNEIAFKQKEEEERRQQEELRRMAQERAQENEMKLKAAKDQVLKEKAENTAILKSEKERAKRRKEVMERYEEEQRQIKVKELKALLSQPRPSGVTFDPTTTAKVGVLDEMSYAELQELLVKEKERLEREESMKRQEILEHKTSKKQELLQLQENIMRAREKRSILNTKKTQSKREQQLLIEKTKQKEYELSLQKYQEDRKKKLEVMENEKQRLIEAEKEIQVRQKQLGNTMNGIEKYKEDELMKAVERQTKQQYESFVTQVRDKEDIKIKESMNRTTIQTIQKTIKLKNRQEKDIEILHEKMKALDTAKRISQQKIERTQLIKSQLETNREKLNQLNIYATTITSIIQEESKQRQQSKLGGRAILSSSSSSSNATSNSKDPISTKRNPTSDPSSSESILPSSDILNIDNNNTTTTTTVVNNNDKPSSSDIIPMDLLKEDSNSSNNPSDLLSNSNNVIQQDVSISRPESTSSHTHKSITTTKSAPVSTTAIVKKGKTK